MRLIIQRVSKASILIDAKIKRDIEKGYVLLVGITEEDSIEDINWIVRKVVNMRLFNDENSVMNLSILDIDGNILLVSQFTLYASTKKGNRPSYIKAAKPDIAVPLYEALIKEFENAVGKSISTGEFGSDMKVNIHNDGPVTILLDSKNKE